MRNARRKVHSRRQFGEWAVVMTPMGGTGLWVAHWMELQEPWRISMEIDADPARNITGAAWGRARRAVGVPERIFVIDEETAALVRRSVPARVAVVVDEAHPAIRELLEDIRAAEDEARRCPVYHA